MDGSSVDDDVGADSIPALTPTASSTFATSSSSGLETLRPGWVEAVDPSSGRRFHWSAVTGETVWIDHNAQADPQAAPMLSRPASPGPSLAGGHELARRAVELDQAGDRANAAAAYIAAAEWMCAQQDPRFASKAAEYRARAAELRAQFHGME